MRATIIILAVLLAACDKPPVNTTSTNNPQVPVSTLFTHEGCTVYRFNDGGKSHYYTRCDGGTVSTGTGVTENCGKGCTRVEYHNIPTIEVQK